MFIWTLESKEIQSDRESNWPISCGKVGANDTGRELVEELKKVKTLRSLKFFSGTGSSYEL